MAPLLPGGGGPEDWRRENLSLVLSHVHRQELSRAELTSVTGLNRSTIGTLVAELAERGLVVEGEAVRDGKPGRPSPIVRPAQDGPVVLAVDIEIDSLACAAVGLGGTVRSEHRLDRTRSDHDVDETLDAVTELVEQVRTDVGATAMVGTGIAVAGIVRREDGMLRMAPNLGWSDVPLRRRVAERLDVDPTTIQVVNEADAGASAEHLRGAGVDVADLIYLSAEVGVGAGIIVGGSSLRGANGYAAEVGHIPVNRFGLRCGCGARGCWETEISERALLRAAGRTRSRGPGAVDALLADADAGDSEVLAALAEVGRWLGVGLAGLVGVFDPQRIVLGDLFGSIHPYIIAEVDAELRERARLPSGETIEIVPGVLGPRASLLGAAEEALVPLLADPGAFEAERGLRATA